MDKKYIYALITGAFAGSGITYALTSRVFRERSERYIAEEVQAVRAEYAGYRYLVDDKPDIEDFVAARLQDDGLPEGEIKQDGFEQFAQRVVQRARLDSEEAKALLSEQYDTPSEEPEDVEFLDTDADTALSLALDVENRSSDEPYIISVEEWENPRESPADINDQLSLTYFEADDVLVDVRDNTPVAIEYTVGHDVLTKFGYDRRHHDAIFVRSEQAGCDYQITRDSRSYEEVVLGIVPEKVSKRKLEDD